MALNNLRQHKTILYRLKRTFGQTVVFMKPIENDYDVTTGAMSRSYLEISVRRAIVLPSQVERVFNYDLSFIASNKNFTYGGFFDKDDRNIIVQKKDLNGWVPELDWRCTFKNHNYNFRYIVETEDGAGYLMKCKALDETA